MRDIGSDKDNTTHACHDDKIISEILSDRVVQVDDSDQPVPATEMILLRDTGGLVCPQR